MKLGRRPPMDDPQVKNARAEVSDFAQAFREAAGPGNMIDLIFSEMIFPAVDLVSRYEAGRECSFLAALYLSLLPQGGDEPAMTAPVREWLEKIRSVSEVTEALFDSVSDSPLMMDMPEKLSGADMLFVRQYICAVALFMENFGLAHLRRIREDLAGFAGAEFMLAGIMREVVQSHEKSIRIIEALLPTAPGFDAALRAGHKAVCDEMKKLMDELGDVMAPDSAQPSLPLSPGAKKPAGP